MSVLLHGHGNYRTTINHEFYVAFNGAGKKYPKAPLVKAPGKQKCNKEEEETASVGMIIFWTRKS